MKILCGEVVTLVQAHSTGRLGLGFHHFIASFGFVSFHQDTPIWGFMSWKAARRTLIEDEVE